MQAGRRIFAASTVVLIGTAALASAAGAAPREALATARPSASLRSHASASSSATVSLTAVSDTAGNKFVFWRGEDGNLWSAVYTAASGTWSSAPIVVSGMGPLATEPTAVVYSSGDSEYVYVFWKGNDGNLWYTYGIVTPGSTTTATSVGSWSAATAITGLAPLGSQPAATYVSAGADRGIDVLWEGSDSNLWSAILSGAGGALSLASGPTGLGEGPLGSAPTVGSDAAGNIYVFWQGSGNNTHVWEAWYDASASTPTWSGPIDLGAWTGNTGSAPSVAVDSAGDQYVFWQGQNGALYYADWNGSYWSGWTSVGYSPMNSAPAAIVNVAGSPVSASGLTVLWKGTDLNMWYATYQSSNATWTGPNAEVYGPLDS